MKQRYGDCKAKSFLLSEILQILDFNANPILVNSYNGINIQGELPSPNSFNHCIVQLEKDNVNYFIDPTISNQGGNTTDLYVPNYVTGLPLKKGETNLVKIQSKSDNKIHITEEFDIEEVEGTTYLYITSKYKGSYADNIRTSFAQKQREKIEKEYLDFYSTLYPSIRSFSKIEFLDSRINNEVTIKESYFIDSLWTKTEANKDLLAAELYPLYLENYIYVKKSPKRTMPYFVEHPVNFEQDIFVNLPEDWVVETETKTVEEKAFKFTQNITYANRTLHLNYTYQTFKNHISAEETNTFVNKHDQILQELSYFLTYNTQLISEQHNISWALVFFGMLIFALGCFGSYKIYTTYDIPPKGEPIYTSIGGWLVFVAIGVVLTPLVTTIQISQNFNDFYGKTTWYFITNNHESLSQFAYSMLIIVEIVYNSLFVAFSVLVAALFFKRRTILPKMIIILFSATFVFLTLDSVIAFNLNDNLYNEMEKVQSFKEIGTSFIKAIIWIPYFLVSKRVKSTFTEVYFKH